MATMRMLGVLVMGFISLVSCGNGQLPLTGEPGASEPPGAPPPGAPPVVVGGVCGQLTATICAKACDCRPIKADGSECYVRARTANGGSRTSGRNPLPCASSLGRDVCGDTTKPAALLEACQRALGQSMCMADNDRGVLVLPDACAGLLDCNGGPCKN
jgi:hypothetical protein